MNWLQSRRQQPLKVATSHSPLLSSFKQVKMSSSWSASLLRTGNTIYLLAAMLLVGTALTLINMFELHRMQKEHMSWHEGAEVEGREGQSGSQLTYWVYGKHVDSGYLSHVFAVLDRIGFVRTSQGSNWDLLWAHDYPFKKLRHILIDIKPHQRVNHFPGSGYITNKVNLASSEMQFIPKAFKIPSEKSALLEYAEKHPDKMFVQKSNNHRGIMIKKVDSLDLDTPDTFVQEFIDKPYLIDGRKFDIGIYTIITSINPLRIYIYDGDAIFRFCTEDYYPFHVEDVKKYVVRDDYTPIWEIPELGHFYTDMGLSMKASFNAYMHKKGHDPSKIWEQVEEAIRTMCLMKEPTLIKASSAYSSTTNFFELMRFDFALDEDLNVYLMEANMSPNLSSKHFRKNKLLYEKVLYNLFGLVGIAQRVQHENLLPRSDDDFEMQVSNSDVMVYPDECSNQCKGDCTSVVCQLCRQCISPSNLQMLKMAYLEHVNRGSCRRIMPPAFISDHKSGVSSPGELEGEGWNKENKLMLRWFYGKCLQDPRWCR